MKNYRALFFVLTLAAAAPAFAEQREYFVEDVFWEFSEAPRPRASQFYKNQPEATDAKCLFCNWFNSPHALGDLGGVRSALEEYGVVPVITYLGNFAANPCGGDRHGAAVSSSVNLGYGVDLQKLFKTDALKGWSFVNTWVWRFGDSLTKDYLRNTFSVQQNYGSQTIRMQSMFLSYNTSFDGDERNHLMFKFGRIAAGDNFMTKPIYWLYMSNSIDGNPVGVYNQVKFSAYPSAVWGAMGQISLANGLYFKAGVYQINSDSQEKNSRHGLDFSFTNGLGVNANFEAGWNINHDCSGKNPGNISVGFVADWYSVERLSNPMRHSHFNQTIYFQADYMVWNLGLPDRSAGYVIDREPHSDTYRDLRGLVLWGALQYDPSEDLAYMPLFITAGAFFNAPFESRPDDVLCFGFSYGQFSDKLNAPERDSYEIVLELNYKLQVNKFFFLQPDIQYVINTKGGQYPDALVLGLQFGSTF